ncbi:hypothetical protein [Reyranella sp.]|uniref:hypothetical protein n=1 Tax=Reyranella sp. TaxID=1929291 RepID=UPI003BA978C7
MKMNAAQIERTLDRLNSEALNAQTIPPEHPIIPQLERMFGEHTYFLDGRGLSIVEPVDAEQSDARRGVVINIASWADTGGDKLQPHGPEPTATVVELDVDTRQ